MKKIFLILLLLTPYQLMAMDFYIKGGGAWAKTSIDANNLNINDRDTEDDNLSLKGALGISIEYVAIEIGLIDTKTASLDDIFGDNHEANGEYISLFLRYPTQSGPTIFAQVGYINWEARFDFLFDDDRNIEGKDPFYGLGVEINLNSNSSLNFEVEHYPFDDIKMTRTGVNYKYSFGI